MRDLGPTNFKNVAEPECVYALEFEGEASVGTLPVDPVCHMAVEPDRAAATREIGECIAGLRRGVRHRSTSLSHAVTGAA